MAANYPSSLPVKDSAGSSLASNPHSSLHDGMYDEIVAIGTELGTNPKGTAATVKARLDDMPAGVIAYTDKKTAQDGITTIVDVSGLSATWTAVSGRYYRTSVYVLIDTNWTSGEVRPVIYLTDGSNNQVQVKPEPAIYTSADYINVGVGFSFVETGLSGSVTRKVRAETTGTGVGTIDVKGFAAAPAFLLVEDIGAA